MLKRILALMMVGAFLAVMTVGCGEDKEDEKTDDKKTEEPADE